MMESMTGRRVTRWTPTAAAKELGIPKSEMFEKLRRDYFAADAVVREGERWYIVDIEEARACLKHTTLELARRYHAKKTAEREERRKSLSEIEVDSWRGAQAAAARKRRQDEESFVPKAEADKRFAELAALVSQSLDELPAAVAAAVSDARVAKVARRTVKAHMEKVKARIQEKLGKNESG